jgi:sterol desaturase/sphingolipid hydroxylase (fatty acid hydroxylase superfamily)
VSAATRASVRLGAQPVLLGLALLVWLSAGRGPIALAGGLLTVLASTTMLEFLTPAKPGWRLTGRQWAALVTAHLALALLFGLVADAYERLLRPALQPLSEALFALLWPHEASWLVQAIALFLLSDFVYYWVHRGIHACGPLWRASGHAVHHSFHNLHAVHAGLAHPMEVALLAGPLPLLAATFGITADVVGAATVVVAGNAILAHSNLDIDPPVLRLVLTNSNQHRVHHSRQTEQSNRNFACNAIVWDRLFGTLAAGPVSGTGTGPRQPGLRDMLTAPFR